MPRQIAMYLAREMTDNSLPKIGKSFGGKDHTTVIHAHEKIAQEMNTDERLQNDVRELKNNLRTKQAVDKSTDNNKITHNLSTS